MVLFFCFFSRVYSANIYRHSPNGTPAPQTSPPSDTADLPRPDPRPELDVSDYLQRF